MASIIDWLRNLPFRHTPDEPDASTFSKRPTAFRDSRDFWIQRYAMGGTSGPGSYGRLAKFKARVINEFVRTHVIKSVIEFGCGDGNQLRLAKYPSYTGYDISPEALARCRTLFAHDPSKTFKLMEEYAGERAGLTLSLDVIFHLLEDEVYDDYMRRLFDASYKYVIIYSSNQDEDKPPPRRPIRHRQFTNWIAQNRPQCCLLERIPNEFPLQSDPFTESFCDFYIYGWEPVG